MAEHIVGGIETFLPLLIPIIIAISGGTAVGFWALLKRKISNVREFIVALDDAIRDDSLSAEEIRLLGGLLLKIIQKDPDVAAALLNSKKQ